MAEVIADLFQRQTLGEESPGAGVSQRVRSVATSLNTQALQALGDNPIEAGGSHRADWREDLQKHLAQGALLADFPEITDDGLTNRGDERIDLSPALL